MYNTYYIVPAYHSKLSGVLWFHPPSV